MAKAVHKATDKLSDDARRELYDGFRRKLTYAAIAARLKTLGEPVPVRTIGNEAIRWRAEQRRLQLTREQASALIAAVKEHNLEASDIAAALVADGLAASGITPSVSVGIEAEKVKLQREKLALEREKHLLDREKFAELKDREKRAKEALAPGKTKDPAAALKAIRQMFGVADAA